MGEGLRLTIYQRMFLPAMLCALAEVIALLWGARAELAFTGAINDYFQIALTTSVLAALLWCGLPFLRQPEFRAMLPSQAAPAWLRARWPLLLFPLLISPTFNLSYTIAKSASPHLVGFHGDWAFARADRILFGTDAWRLTHAIIGPTGSRALSFVYTYVWGVLFVGFGATLNLFGSVETTIRYHSARMLTWLVGGVVVAAWLSAAGPAFADLADARLALEFSPLKVALARILPATDPLLLSQDYLRETLTYGEVVRAGGISAMPSMHVATAALFACVCWPTRLRWPSVIFWLTIWVSSVHFGFHYAVDGAVGSMFAWLAWRASAPIARRGTASLPSLDPYLVPRPV